MPQGGRCKLNAIFFRKKISAALCLLLALGLLLSGCKKAPAPVEDTTEAVSQTEPVLPQGSITVPYTELDAVNPFFCKTLLNASLVSLVYDGLFYLDAGFNPQPCIAKEASTVEKTVRVTLDDALVFSDAAPLTAADVVYSFNKASAAPLYKEALRGFESCEADGSYTAVFTLKSPDVNALNLLTFPIVKLGTAETEGDIPVGSGCYLYKKDDLRTYLEYNLRHAGGIPEIGTVRLREVNESATLMHQLNTGAIDCFFTDMSDGVAKRSYSGATEIYLNNLVFLGVNSASALLGTADIRKAVSLAISRQALAENAFVSHARVALTPMNPSWDALTAQKDPLNAKYESDPNAADAVLAGLRHGSTGEPLYYTLLVDSSNAFLRAAADQIAEQLALVNLQVTVEPVSTLVFNEALRTGDFDFYLSEIKLTKNMDLSPFFTAGGAAASGIDLSADETADAYLSYRSGETELTEFLEAFDASLPFIPLLYRNGQFCFSRSIKSGVESTEDRLFLNVAQWKV